MKLQGVLFDLWGTLIHDTPERGRPRQTWRTNGVRDVLLAYDVDIDYDIVMRALDGASRMLTGLHDTGRDTDSLGRVSIFIDELAKETTALVPVDSYGGLEAAITGMPLELAPPAGPNALGALAAIKALGLRTALISNVGTTTSPNLRPILDAYGFSAHFDALIFSDELGIAKPDKAIFDLALGAIGLTAEACAFVGDAPHNDVFGAQAAGLFTVQIGDRAHDSINPDARILDLGELVPTLAAHGLLGLPSSLGVAPEPT